MSTTLTIYTNNYDSEESILNDGLSGKTFVDIDNLIGMSFESLDEALKYCSTNNLDLDKIEFNYLSPNDKIQMFKKFNVEKL